MSGRVECSSARPAPQRLRAEVVADTHKLSWSAIVGRCFSHQPGSSATSVPAPTRLPTVCGLRKRQIHALGQNLPQQVSKSHVDKQRMLQRRIGWDLVEVPVAEPVWDEETRLLQFRHNPEDLPLGQANLLSEISKPESRTTASQRDEHEAVAAQQVASGTHRAQTLRPT